MRRLLLSILVVAAVLVGLASPQPASADHVNTYNHWGNGFAPFTAADCNLMGGGTCTGAARAQNLWSNNGFPNGWNPDNSNIGDTCGFDSGWIKVCVEPYEVFDVRRQAAGQGNRSALAQPVYTTTGGAVHIDRAVIYLCDSCGGADATRGGYVFPFDLDFILAHEYGHLLGLGHNQIEPASLMRGDALGGQRPLAHDVDAMRVMYSPHDGSGFTSSTPTRVLDTRSPPSTAVGAGQTRSFRPLGDSSLANVTSVVMNVTAISPTAETYLTVWPEGAPRPNVSSINIPPGDTRANTVTVRLGRGGNVSIYNGSGSVHVAVDLAGVYSVESSSRFTPSAATRFWDSRVGPGPRGRVGPGATVDIQPFGLSPPAGITAVVFNLTVVGATAETFLTVWPNGGPRPNASNINVPAGDTRANLVTVQKGVNPSLLVYNAAGSVHVIADLAGWYTGVGGTSKYVPALAPERVHDTRASGVPVQFPFDYVRLFPSFEAPPFAGPAILTEVTAVLGNLTAISPSTSTFLTVWSFMEGTQPNASNLNVPQGDIRANAFLVRARHPGLDPGTADGNVAVGSGSSHVAVDASGWFIRTV